MVAGVWDLRLFCASSKVVNDNAEAESECGYDPWQDQEARLFVVGELVVVRDPELQVQESDPRREERRIHYARAYMEADELEISGLDAQELRVPEVRAVADRRRRCQGRGVVGGQASSSGVGEEARRHALGDERDSVAES